MFGWFRSKPTCPVAPPARAWIESRTRWLVSEFGLAAARNAAAVLPTPEFFPEKYDASDEAGRILFESVCRHMRIDPRGLTLYFFESHRPLVNQGFFQSQSAAGLYENGAEGIRIQIDAKALEDPLTLVATAAHELSHVLLLGQGRLTGGEPDHEEITDLLTVYLGFGVFTANTRVRDRASSTATTESWSISKLGYLGQPEVGYALALWARLREETNPAWASALCADVRAYFRQGVRWLDAEGDSVLDAKSGSPRLLSDDEAPPGFEPRK
jgi:hypothetical protein